MKNYQIISEGKVLFEGESEDPFEELYLFKKKTFGDVFDRRFRASPLKEALKGVMNHGGEITIKIIK